MGNNKFSIASVGNRRAFRDGARDGVPIALGYFAVSFSLGIVARNVGMTPIQGMITSALCNASAGEYAGFTMIAAVRTFPQSKYASESPTTMLPSRVSRMFAYFVHAFEIILLSYKFM